MKQCKEELCSNTFEFQLLLSLHRKKRIEVFFVVCGQPSVTQGKATVTQGKASDSTVAENTSISLYAG